MKVEAQVGINAYAEVVVHDEDGRGVLVGVGRVTLVLNRDSGLVDLLVVRVKNHSPSVIKRKVVTIGTYTITVCICYDESTSCDTLQTKLLVISHSF